MTRLDRFSEALRRFDDANRQDPRTKLFEGVESPRELLFATRAYEWVERLAENPSEELLLAARGHTIRRWAIPRDRYPRNNAGYHRWREALARYHAREAGEILREVGYGSEQIQRVKLLISRQAWPADPEARVLEDADCLTFLELKLHEYLDRWDEERILHILRTTMGKMTPEACERARTLDLTARELDLLGKAGA